MNSDAKRAEDMRVRYLTEAIETATPASRLTMLFDALEMDLARAGRGFETERPDIKAISDLLIHAQDILCTLRDTLDVSVWEPASRLRALYDHLYGELVKSNLEKDPALVAGVAEHVSHIAEAWREAARRAEPSSMEPV